MATDFKKLMVQRRHWTAATIRSLRCQDGAYAPGGIMEEGLLEQS